MRTWLYEARKKAKRTQQQVADAAGISRVQYLRIEKGQRGNPVKPEISRKIAGYLGLDWTRFYEAEDDTQSSA